MGLIHTKMVEQITLIAAAVWRPTHHSKLYDYRHLSAPPPSSLPTMTGGIAFSIPTNITGTKRISLSL